MNNLNMRLWEHDRQKYVYDTFTEMGSLFQYDDVTSWEEVFWQLKKGDNSRFVGELFIGKYDKNDFPIYVGDIVRRTGDKKYVVIWDEWCFNLKDFIEPSFDYPTLAFSEGISLQVIGNIREHSHLLKGES